MEKVLLQLPQGVRDLGPAEAKARRELMEVWSHVFARWGYQEVIPPTFEFYNTLAHGFAGRKAERLFRFLDRQGRTLALRPDFTTQIARLAATKLADEPRPLRLWYCGPVFRAQETRNGQRSEFTQAGVELIGAAGPGADAEVVALSLTLLDKAGVAGARLSLGHTGFLRALLEELSLGAEEKEAIVGELLRRNLVGLRDVLGAMSLPEETKQALGQLPGLLGGAEVLEAAERLAAGNRSAQEALQELKAVARLLKDYGLAGCVSFDLGLARELDYYTSLVFEGYVPGFGYPVCGGGRYDNLCARYGLPAPATGFALELEQVLAVRERQGVVASPEVPEVLVVAAPGHEGEAVREAARLRERQRVELALCGLDARAAAAYAQRRAIRRVVMVGSEGSGRV